MTAARVDRAYLRRIEAAIADAVRGVEPVRIAYSGGLASTLVAAIARKRAESRCIVAGTAESPDVRASEVAKDYMDYRVEIVRLDRRTVPRLLRDIQVAYPGLTTAERHSLVPLWAAIGHSDGPILSGFGPTRLRPLMWRVLRDSGAQLPLRVAARADFVPRARLRSVARNLGLPSAFADVRRRPPSRGAGIAEFLHENAIRRVGRGDIDATSTRF